MSWTPTDEQALVVKAELGTHGVECTGPGEVTCRCREGGWMSWSAFNEHQARAVLVAVGPMIAAGALRDAAATQDEESARIREAYRQHNAHRDPNRPPRRPDLNTWSNADEATAHRLRARADTIEKEAGR